MLLLNNAIRLLCLLCAAFVCGNANSDGDDKKKEEKSEKGVLIDFSNWSECYDVDDVTLQIEFEGRVDEPVRYEGGNGFPREDFAQSYYLLMTTPRLGADGVIQAERVGKTKVRILGWTDKKGVFHPAIKGIVTSKKLKPDQIPKVTNPKKA